MPETARATANVAEASPPRRYARLRARRISMIELLVTLVLMIVATPFLSRLPHGSLIEAILLSLVLFAALVVVGATRRMRWLATVLAVPAVAGKWINYWRPDVLPAEAYLACAMLFVAFVAVNLLRFTLRAPRVDAEVLCAALSNYLLIGLLWTFAYLLTARLVPAAFSFSSGPASSQTMDGFNALYFSFVTLSTIGYGDITPQAEPARMLAIVEASVGMFYMTVLVARLVSLYSSERSQQGAPGRKNGESGRQ